jgi:protein-disulfide isomerase
MTTPFSAPRLLAALAAVVLFAPGCNKERTPAVAQSGAAPACSAELPPDQVIATYDDKKITGKQLQDQIGNQLQQLAEQRYNTIKQGAEQAALQDIVHQQAQAKGMSDDDFLKQQIEAGVPEPTDKEISDFYDQNKAQMGGQSLDQMKPRISAFLKQQKSRKNAADYFAKLEKEHNVKVSLERPKRPKKNVEAKGPSRGPNDAKVTIIEFSDFQCPFCFRAYDTVEQVMKNYDGKVRLVYRQFPLSIHAHAQKAAEASLCALDQGKFWEMYHSLFKHHEALEVEQIKGYAKELGLDAAKFDKCLDSGEKQAAVQSDQSAGEAVGVSATPTFFINGEELEGAQPYEEFQQTIDAALAEKK